MGRSHTPNNSVKGHKPDAFWITLDDLVTAGPTPITVNLGSQSQKVALSGIAATVVGRDGNNTIRGGEGLTTIDLGNGDNHICLNGGLNTIVLGNGNNVVSAGDGTVRVTVGSTGIAIAMKSFATFLPGQFSPGTNNIGAFDGGTGNIGAFDGLGNSSSTDGNNNIGALNGNLNGGVYDGNNNIGSLNGNLNGYGATGANDGGYNGNYNTGSLNGNLNGFYATDNSSGNQNGNANFGAVNGNKNGVGADPASIAAPKPPTGQPLLGSFDTVVVGNGNNTIETGGYSTVVTGNGCNYVAVDGGHSSVQTGSGDDVVSLVGSNNFVDAGGGMNLIYTEAGDSTFMLPTAGTGKDTIYGFSMPRGDMLDLKDVLAGEHWDGTVGSVGSLISTYDQYGSTYLCAQSGGTLATVGVLVGVNTDLQTLMAHNVVLS